YRAIEASASSLRAAAESLVLEAGDPSTALATHKQEMAKCQDAINAAQEHERARESEWRELPKEDPKKDSKPPERARGYSARRVVPAITDLSSWLGSPVGRKLERIAYFLTGQAGSGKTHLFLDATKRALDAGRSAVFLAGARFGRGDLWGSICDQLGLE